MTLKCLYIRPIQFVDDIRPLIKTKLKTRNLKKINKSCEWLLFCHDKSDNSRIFLSHGTSTVLCSQSQPIKCALLMTKDHFARVLQKTDIAKWQREPEKKKLMQNIATGLWFETAEDQPTTWSFTSALQSQKRQLTASSTSKKFLMERICPVGMFAGRSCIKMESWLFSQLVCTHLEGENY